MSEFNWREHLPVHPAADLFPLMSEQELRELADDFLKNGLRTAIVLWGNEPKDATLIDGRNRLDALAVAGLLSVHDGQLFTPCWIDTRWIGKTKCWTKTRWHDSNSEGVKKILVRGDDPFAYALSLNIHRRHLTAEQKRDLIAELLKADPSKSDRQIAEQTKSSPTTVGKVRAEKEASGDVSKVDTRTDSKGRKQPSSKPKAAEPEVTPRPATETYLHPVGTILNSRDIRHAEQANEPIPPALVVQEDGSVAEKTLPDAPSITFLDKPWLAVETNEGEAAAADDPLVIPNPENDDEILASPWFASKIKPIIKGESTNDPAKSAEALRKFRNTCSLLLPQLTDNDLVEAQNILSVVSDLRFDVEREADRAKEAIAKAKRIKWEAKHPEEAKEKARELAQAEAMQDEIEDAKTEARENGERWGDVKDEWADQWITDNWDEDREAEFEAEFQERWKADHGSGESVAA